jgi:polysaccharide pyruvyl transferase WcaK-like protein
VGDTALYRVIRDLFAPVQVGPDLHPYQAVMVGGGTLIFRSGSLGAATAAMDACGTGFVFGTGVADPAFDEVLHPEAWRSILDRCFFVGVRGTRSLEVLRECGYDGPAEVIGDPALLLAGPLRTSTSDSIVINFFHVPHSRLWGWDNEAVRTAVLSVARRLLTMGYRLIFLSFESRHDRYLHTAMAELDGGAHLELVPGYEDLDRTLTILAQADLVIGEKLHAAVLAAAAGTPFISLEYRPKCRDFAATLGVEDLVLRTDALTTGRLLELVEYVRSERDSIRTRMEERVSLYRRRLHDAAQQVKASLEDVAR